MKQIKKWQEPIYAISGFGTSFMYQVATSYLLYRYVPTSSYLAKGAVVLAPAILFGVLFTISRAFDGVVDIPLANWTDNLRSKWGRRRPAIAIGVLPMIATYVLMWLPPVQGVSVWNAVYAMVMSMLFFTFYTLSAVAYLAALSEIVPDERSRVRVASWQAFFNTIGYVLAYVVVPVMFDKLGMVNTILICSPIMLLMALSLLVIKEDSTKGGVAGEEAEPKVSMFESIKLTLKNQQFRAYLYTLVTFFFALQLFLSGLKYMANDMMGLSDTQLGLMNAAAFAPIPLMLLLFYWINKKKGVRFALRVALITFAVAMLIFASAWTKIGIPLSPFIIGIIAGGVGSFSIGAFFTIPHALPAQIAAEEAAATGKNRCGMYFAVQGLINQVVAAIAGSLIIASLMQLDLTNTAFGTGAVFIAPLAALSCIASFVLAGKLAGKKETK